MITKAKPTAHFGEMTIAKYISQQLDIVGGMGKTQRQVAEECGYDRPNIISMFKTGDAKVPLDKIPALARALNVDPATMYRLAIRQYWPADEKAISSIFGTVLSRAETEIMDYVREVAKGTEVSLTPELKRAIKTAITGK